MPPIATLDSGLDLAQDLEVLPRRALDLRRNVRVYPRVHLHATPRAARIDDDPELSPLGPRSRARDHPESLGAERGRRRVSVERGTARLEVSAGWEGVYFDMEGRTGSRRGQVASRVVPSCRDRVSKLRPQPHPAQPSGTRSSPSRELTSKCARTTQEDERGDEDVPRRGLIRVGGTSVARTRALAVVRG